MIRLVIALLLFTACGDDPGVTPSDAGAGSTMPDLTAGGELLTPVTDAEVDVETDVDAGPDGCHTHDDCGSRFCDRLTGACLDCLVHAHCPLSAPVCRAGACAEAEPCSDVAPCPAGVCGATGVCVDCTTGADCNGVCANEVCHTGALPCDGPSDCTPYAMHCAGTCADCLVDSHCATLSHCKGGVCQPDVCVPSTIAPECSGQAAIAQCAPSGGGYENVACEDDWRCEPAVGGTTQARCAPVICTAGARECTTDTAYTLCNLWGTAETTVACPAGSTCVDGGCRAPTPVILVIFDTSSSMWGYPEGGAPEQCAALGVTCVPPWPQCEAETDGLTLMGRSKRVFSKLFGAFASKAHFALMRFPQREIGAAGPTCKSGFYAGMPVVDGDPDDHETLPGGWFTASSGQVALALPTSGTDLPEIQRWLDDTETVEATEQECETDGDCVGFCALATDGVKRCHVHDDPELRAVGQTPLGRSLFYAGELLRHHVAVDGRPCQSAEDCGTPFHGCVGGACQDPGRNCRRFMVLLFTDGAESVDTSLESWFHPRNQAKRLHFGLGCTSDGDCGGGAKCAGGTCQSASVSLNEKICSDTGVWCQSDDDCKGSFCIADVSTYVDPLGMQRLVDLAGKPIPVTVSVVTVGYERGHAETIAGWGGGEAVAVSDASSTLLLDELSKLVSAKIQAECAP